MTIQDALQASAKDLQVRMQEHLCLLTAATKGKPDVCACNDCRLWNCSHKQALKRILTESITVLEDTRKSFKSKQLEELRKKLLRVLTETV